MGVKEGCQRKSGRIPRKSVNDIKYGRMQGKMQGKKEGGREEGRKGGRKDIKEGCQGRLNEGNPGRIFR